MRDIYVLSAATAPRSAASTTTATRALAARLALISVFESTGEVMVRRRMRCRPLLILAALLACSRPAAGLGQTCVAQCTADCDDGGDVTIDELLRAIRIALGGAAVVSCAVADRNADGAVTTDELVAG